MPARMAAQAKSNRQNRLGNILTEGPHFSDGTPLNLDDADHFDHMVKWWAGEAGVSLSVSRDDLHIVQGRLRRMEKAERVRRRASDMYDKVATDYESIPDEAGSIMQEYDIPAEDDGVADDDS